MRAIAVIGAGFGDEGKGAAVDALVASAAAQPVVVRFNGGAQAGHTVVTPWGHRHVFSHFGSGSLAGASTYLSRFFVASPHLFLQERAELMKLPAFLEVAIDPEAEMTTPYDVMINRCLERSRGDNRHGSVGVGFGETVLRAERGIRFPASLLFSPPWKQFDELLAVRGYTALRLSELNLHDDETLDDMKVTGVFLREMEEMADYVRVRPIYNELYGRDIIFEGAQGLLLDQTHGFEFPHLTRSNTGMKNVAELARAIDIDSLQIHYMMRAYTTRHGAGPLVGEVKALNGIDVVDKTNIAGEWQGNFRLAPLMNEHIKKAIETDLQYAPPGSEAGAVVSCLDQVTSHRHENEIIDKVYGILPVSGTAHGLTRKERNFWPPEVKKWHYAGTRLTTRG